jgi:hypothetical protein
MTTGPAYIQPVLTAPKTRGAARRLDQETRISAGLPDGQHAHMRVYVELWSLTALMAVRRREGTLAAAGRDR